MVSGGGGRVSGGILAGGLVFDSLHNRFVERHWCTLPSGVDFFAEPLYCG